MGTKRSRIKCPPQLNYYRVKHQACTPPYICLYNWYMYVQAGAEPGFERGGWHENFVGELHESCALSTFGQKLNRSGLFYSEPLELSFSIKIYDYSPSPMLIQFLLYYSLTYVLVSQSIMISQNTCMITEHVHTHPKLRMYLPHPIELL